MRTSVCIACFYLYTYYSKRHAVLTFKPQSIKERLTLMKSKLTWNCQDVDFIVKLYENLLDGDHNYYDPSINMKQ
jgi:hypothetical protein